MKTILKRLYAGIMITGVIAAIWLAWAFVIQLIFFTEGLVILRIIFGLFIAFAVWAFSKSGDVTFTTKNDGNKTAPIKMLNDQITRDIVITSAVGQLLTDYDVDAEELLGPEVTRKIKEKFGEIPDADEATEERSKVIAIQIFREAVDRLLNAEVTQPAEN